MRGKEVAGKYKNLIALLIKTRLGAELIYKYANWHIYIFKQSSQPSAPGFYNISSGFCMSLETC